MVKVSPEFYRDKRIFVTGHTGFKGMWLCKLLKSFGAEVTGYSLTSPTEEGGKVFSAIGLEKSMHSVVGDVRDYSFLKKHLMRQSQRLSFILPLSLSFSKVIGILSARTKQM